MLATYIDDISNFLEGIILSSGIPGIVFIAFMENIFPPTPSEFLYPLAGKLAYEGKMNLLLVIIAGACGSIAGAIVFYYAGYSLGEERMRGFIEHYGTIHLWRWRITLFTVDSFDQAMISFDKHGGKIVMIARTMPLVHGVISVPAGINHMNLPKFLIYSFIGVLLWLIPTTLAGFFLGSQWDLMLSLLDTYETLWYIIFILLLLYYVASRWRNETLQKSPDNKGAAQYE